MGGKESKVESSAESKPASTPSSQSRSTGDVPEQQIPAGGGEGDGEKKLKPCCACPETKQARDECIVEQGEENCQKLIEAHKECLRKHGFKV